MNAAQSSRLARIIDILAFLCKPEVLRCESDEILTAISFLQKHMGYINFNLYVLVLEALAGAKKQAGTKI